MKIRLSQMKVENIREWGACWLGLYLWDLVGLDTFWTEKRPRSSHGTDWLAVFKALVLYRLTAPGSEWKMHRDWYDETAVRDLQTHSRARFTKEHAMRLAKMRAIMKVLHAIDVRIGRRPEFGEDGKPVARERKALSRDELVSRLAVATSKAGRSWRLFRIGKPKATETTVTQENLVVRPGAHPRGASGRGDVPAAHEHDGG